MISVQSSKYETFAVKNLEINAVNPNALAKILTFVFRQKRKMKPNNTNDLIE